MPTTYQYTSDDAGAPLLTSEMPQPDASSLGNLLKACLVSGYGARPAAGWTNPYADGSGKYVLRQGGGSQEYLYLYDGHPSYGGQTVNLKGFETMSALEIGTNPYPTTAIATFTAVYVKVASATPCTWILVADDRTFYFYSRLFSGGAYAQLWFGDFYSQLTSGLYRSFLQCHSPLSRQAALTTSLAYPEGAWTPRLHNGIYNSADQRLNLYGDTAKGAGYPSIFAGDVPYPASGDNKIWTAKIKLGQWNIPVTRGYLRGTRHWLHQTAAVADRDIWPGTDALAGRNFLLIRDVESGGATKHVLVHETTSWDTN